MIKNVSATLLNEVKQYLVKNSSMQVEDKIFYYMIEIPQGANDNLLLDAFVELSDNAINIVHIHEIELVGTLGSANYLKCKPYCMDGVKGQKGRLFKEMYYKQLLTNALSENNSVAKEVTTTLDPAFIQLLSKNN